MAYFEDLTEYSYASAYAAFNTKNIGWLEPGYEFHKANTSEQDLELLWEYCMLSVAQSRGVHKCNLCEPQKTIVVERMGFRVLLGTSEIRVFSDDGVVFAAPSLIYHYIEVHGYRPPEQFMEALRGSPRPPAEEYIAKLKAIDPEFRVRTSYTG
jgi:hypothetical protein